MIHRAVDLEATRALARRLAGTLKSGDIVTLEGPIGAGKTVFAQSLIAALGVPDIVTSPTYAIVLEYAGRVPVNHVDLYRLQSAEEVELLDLEDLLDHAVTIIEWPERDPTLMSRATNRVTITIESEDLRTIEIAGPGR